MANYLDLFKTTIAPEKVTATTLNPPPPENDPLSNRERYKRAAVTTLMPKTLPFEKGYREAFDKQVDVMRGIDPYMNTVSNRAMQDLDTRAAMERTRASQTAASAPTLTDAARRTGVAESYQQAGINRSKLAGDLATTAQGRQMTAAGQVATLGREAMQEDVAQQESDREFAEGQYQFDITEQQWEKTFGEDKKRYGDTEQWIAYEQAVRAGSFGTAGVLYQEITGKTLDTTQLQQYQDYLNQTQQQEITSRDIANKAAAVGLDAKVYDDVGKWAKSGYDLPYINELLTKNGYDKLSPDQFESIAEEYTITMSNMKTKMNEDQYNYVKNIVNTGGDFRTALPELVKMGLSSSEALQAYNSMRVQYANTLEQNKIAIESLRLQVGDEKFSSMVSRIAAGTRFDAIKKEFPGAELTLSDYQNLYDMSPQAFERAKFDTIYGEGGLEDRKLKITEDTVEAEKYWEASEKLITMATTQLDVKPEDAYKLPEMQEWFKAKYGKDPDLNDKDYRAFAEGEWEAATDSRLTNQFDATMYAINSSQFAKDNPGFADIMSAALADPKTYLGDDAYVDQNGQVQLGKPPPEPEAGTEWEQYMVNKNDAAGANSKLNAAGATLVNQSIKQLIKTPDSYDVHTDWSDFADIIDKDNLEKYKGTPFMLKNDDEEGRMWVYFATIWNGYDIDPETGKQGFYQAMAYDIKNRTMHFQPIGRLK